MITHTVDLEYSVDSCMRVKSGMRSYLGRDVLHFC